VRIALFAALLIACGNDSSGRQDGGPGDDGGEMDSMIDADPNVRGTVTVRIVDKNGVALPGMYVVFIDTDATVTELTTDTAGMAIADVYPNASVTAIRTRGMSYSITTVQALNPGDMITLISAASNISSSEDPFSNRVVPMPGADIVASPGGAQKSGSTATFTTVTPHGLVVGDGVVVSNVEQIAYNGNWTVASVPTSTTFTATIGAGAAPASGTGTIRGATAMKAVPFTVTYPSRAGATGYEVHTSCGTVDVGTATTVPLMLPVGCATNPMDFVVLAKLAGSFEWTQQASVAVTAGGSTTISDTWHARAQLVATYTNPSPVGGDVQLAHFAPYLRGIADAEAGATANGTTMVTVSASAPARAALSTQLVCPSIVTGCLSTPSGSVGQRITHAVTGTAGTFALDLAATQLPWVKADYVAATTTLDVTTMGSAPFDIFEANLRFVRVQTIYTWRVFAPLAQSVKFPTLPATAPGNPTLLASDVPANVQAFIGESDAVNGYRDAIKNPFEALGACDASSNSNVKPYAGTKHRISQWN
jgi:hypothetical protein